MPIPGTSRRDFHEFGDTTEYLGVRIQDGRGVVLDQVAKSVSRVFVLSSRDRDRRRRREFSMSVIIIGRDRLLEVNGLDIPTNSRKIFA